MGWQDAEAVGDAMKACRALLVPSICYEGLPTVILEAFATGTPIICSDQQNLNQIVQDRQTGLLFRIGSGTDLSRVVQYVENHLTLWARLAQNSRQEYARYAPNAWIQATLSLYEEVIAGTVPVARVVV